MSATNGLRTRDRPTPSPDRRPTLARSRRISLPVTLNRKTVCSSSGSTSILGEAITSPGMDPGRAEVSYGRTLKRSSVAMYGSAIRGMMKLVEEEAVPQATLSSPKVDGASEVQAEPDEGKAGPDEGQSPVRVTPRQGPTRAQTIACLSQRETSRPPSEQPPIHFPASSSVPPPSETDRRRRALKRRRVARELVETERRYVAVLDRIKTGFFDPVWDQLPRSGTTPVSSPTPLFSTPEAPGTSASGAGPLLTKQVASEIFANFADIHGLAHRVLAVLEGVALSARLFDDDPDPDVTVSIPLGAALVPLLPFFKLYTLFTRNFNRSQSALVLHSSPTGPSPAFAALVAEQSTSGADEGLSLSHLLLSVIQRIPRYELLLFQLLDLTPSFDPDFRHLTEAKAMVASVAAFLEKGMRDQEEAKKMLEIQATTEGLERPLVVPGRRLLKQGRLVKVGKRGDEQTRAFFLFSDCLLSSVIVTCAIGPEARDHAVPPAQSTSTDSGIRYYSPQQVNLSQLTVVAAPHDTASTRDAFQLLSPLESFVVLARDAEEKQSWIDAIRSAKMELLGARQTLARGLDEDDEAAEKAGPSTAAGVRPRLSTSLGAVRPRSSSSQVSSPLSRALSWIFETDNAEGPVDAEKADDSERNGTDRPTSSVDSLASTSRPHSSASFPGCSAAAGVAPLLLVENYSAPVWIPDLQVGRCMSCQTGFSLMRRRHHCRLCGGVFCAKCSSRVCMPLPIPETAAFSFPLRRHSSSRAAALTTGRPGPATFATTPSRGRLRPKLRHRGPCRRRRSSGPGRPIRS